MNETLKGRLREAPIVPLIQAEDPAIAVETATALVRGGLTVIEIVLRTDNAIDCMRQVSKKLPEAIVGAGTVLSEKQATAVALAGAAFIVSPGLDERVIAVAQSASLPVFPGIATASELQHACNLSLDVVKFFPASLAGGTAMLKALGSVFRGMSFIPTGGIAAANLADYIALPSVLACGGSWLTPVAEINAGHFGAVTRLAEEALVIAGNAKRK